MVDEVKLTGSRDDTDIENGTVDVNGWSRVIKERWPDLINCHSTMIHSSFEVDQEACGSWPVMSHQGLPIPTNHRRWLHFISFMLSLMNNLTACAKASLRSWSFSSICAPILFSKRRRFSLTQISPPAFASAIRTASRITSRRTFSSHSWSSSSPVLEIDCWAASSFTLFESVYTHEGRSRIKLFLLSKYSFNVWIPLQEHECLQIMNTKRIEDRHFLLSRYIHPVSPRANDTTTVCDYCDEEVWSILPSSTSWPSLYLTSPSSAPSISLTSCFLRHELFFRIKPSTSHCVWWRTWISSHDSSLDRNLSLTLVWPVIRTTF